MRRGAMGAGAVWMLSLEELSARAGHSNIPVINGISPYGPISPKKDETTGLSSSSCPTASVLVVQLDGRCHDGRGVCPNLHDGMAVIDEWTGHDDDDERRRWRGGDDDDPWRIGRRRLVLVRNHEGGGGAPYLKHPTGHHL